MSVENLKNHIGYLNIHNKNGKEKICAVIGINTILFQFVSMLIKKFYKLKEKGENMTNLMKNEYKYNANFRKYVDEYCIQNECTLEDAFNDDQIKRKFWIYTEV